VRAAADDAARTAWVMQTWAARYAAGRQRGRKLLDLYQLAPAGSVLANEAWKKALDEVRRREAARRRTRSSGSTNDD